MIIGWVILFTFFCGRKKEPNLPAREWFGPQKRCAKT